MEELVFFCVCMLMKFKEAPHGVMHSERNLNLNQAHQSRHTSTLGKVEEQASRPSGHHKTIMWSGQLIHVVR